MVGWKHVGVSCVAGLGLCLAASCSDTPGSGSVASSSAAASTASTPTINNFVVYAANSVTLGSGDHSVGGNIGVATSNGTSPQLVVAAQDVLDQAHTLYAPAISVGNGAHVGAVDTNSLVNNGGQVGSEGSYPSPMPPMPTIFAANPGATNVTVATGQQQTLTPGSYGVLTDNGALFLKPGTYSFASVSLGNGAQLQAQPAGATSLLIAGSLTTGTGAQIFPAGQLADELTISVSGTDGSNGAPPAASLGANSQLVCILAAPSGSIDFGSNAQATGAFAAINVSAGSNVVFNFQSGFANALPNLSTFVAYAAAGVTLGTQDTSLGGDIGVGVAANSPTGAQLVVGAQDVLDLNHTLYANAVSLGSNASVGDIDSNTLTSTTGALSGTLEPFPASAMPALPLAAAATAGTGNISVSSGQQQTLAPGPYGTLTDDGVLFLQPGAYSFASVTLGNNAQIQALPGGSTSVAVSGTLATGTFAQIFPVGGPAANLSLSVGGNDGSSPAASLGANTQIIALLTVPHGTLSLGNNVLATGAFSGFFLTAGNNVQLNFQSGFPPPPPPSSGSGAIQQLSGYFVGTVLATAPIVGPVPQSTPMTIAMALPVNSLANLQAFVQSVSDPASSSYGRYVSPTAFANMFGLSSTAYGNVGTWAGGQGLTISNQYANNMVMGLTGTAGTIGQALSVNFYYRSRPDGTVFYALDREPQLSLPTTQAQILYIGGLQNYRPNQTALVPGGSCGAGLGAGCLLGPDFVDAYACPGTGLNGANQSIGIYNANDTHFNPADFVTYQSAAGNVGAFGLPLDTVTAVPVDGEQTSPITIALNIKNQASCSAGGDLTNCNGPTFGTSCNTACVSPLVCLVNPNTNAPQCVCPALGTNCGTTTAPSCTDLQNDSSNCGACGNGCTGGQVCFNSGCVCPASQAQFGIQFCNGACKNTFEDVNNCGGCGNACGANQICQASGAIGSQQGVCTKATCSAPNTACGNGCVNLKTDATNCGACGTVCPLNSTCSNGSCVCNQKGWAVCTPPWAALGTPAACTDLQSDPMNCGGCAAINVSPSSSSAAYDHVCGGDKPVCVAAAVGGTSKAMCQATCPSSVDNCSGGSSTTFSNGLGVACPQGYSQCSPPNNTICCPNGYACNGAGCIEEGPENAIDVQAASAMAPAASIFSFEGHTELSVLSAMATFTPPSGSGPMNQISISYYLCADPAIQQLMLEMAAQGVSVFIASGDNGATQAPGSLTSCASINSRSIDLREVGGATITGGTILNVNPFTVPESYNFEQAWDAVNTPPAAPSYFASTGGIFANALLPSYQANAVTSLNPALTPANLNPQVSTTNRMIPDVSMASFNIGFFAGGATPQFGVGDSAAAPLWAGYAALTNQQLQQNQMTAPGNAILAPSVGFLNPAIYEIGSTFYTQGAGVSSVAACNSLPAAGTVYASDFNDIDDCTTNSPVAQTNPCAPNLPTAANPNGSVVSNRNCGYTSLPGYDLVNGWGTPTCALINQLTCPVRCACSMGANCPCTNLDNDPLNCGACGTQCSQGQAECSQGQCLPLILTTVSGGALDLVSDGTNVFVSADTGAILSVPVVGPAHPTLGAPVNVTTVPGNVEAAFLAVDPASNAGDSSVLYFTADDIDSGGTLGYLDAILSVTKPGVAPVVNGGGAETNGVGAVAAFNGQVFWLQGQGLQGAPINPTSAVGVYQIAANNLGGTASQLAPAQEPVAIAADATNVYFVDEQSSNGLPPFTAVIKQVSIASKTVTTLASQSDTLVLGIAVDKRNVYWTDAPFDGTLNPPAGKSSVMAVPIGGGTVTALVSAAYLTGNNTTTRSNPVSDGTNVYFGVMNQSSEISSIWTTAVSGTGVITQYTIGTADVLAIDSQNLYWVDEPTGLVSQYPVLKPGLTPQ